MAEAAASGAWDPTTGVADLEAVLGAEEAQEAVGAAWAVAEDLTAVALMVAGNSDCVYTTLLLSKSSISTAFSVPLHPCFGAGNQLYRQR